MDIEKVAHDTPEKIVTLSIDPASGYSPFHGRESPRRSSSPATRSTSA